MQCVHMIRAATSTLDDTMTRGVKAAYKQARPLTDRELGAAEALPRVIRHQRALAPASSRQPRLMARAARCSKAVLISARVTHLLLVTSRCARL